MPLGDVAANIPEVLRLLARLPYTGGYVLQAARRENEIETVRDYLARFTAWHAAAASVEPDARECLAGLRMNAR